ncbi:hypothetical protein [Corynebacterium hindlerae]|uniref:hypothetical protein n=1 Tax=Corynebacterium hindlerae TaxID=699041 RepID=UPI003AACA8BC
MSVFRPLASDTVRLEICFDDDLLDLMNEAANKESVASYESVTLFASSSLDGARNEVFRCGTAKEFAGAIRDVISTAIVLTADRQPLTQDTPGYFDVYEAVDTTPGITVK